MTRESYKTYFSEPGSQERLDVVKALLDGKEVDAPRVRWRKIPQRGNRPFIEHSLSQLRDDPEGNEY